MSRRTIDRLDMLLDVFPELRGLMAVAVLIGASFGVGVVAVVHATACEGPPAPEQTFRALLQAYPECEVACVR